MPTYQFSSLTPAEGQGYSASRDDLQFFGVTGATATNISITGAYMVRIISTGSSQQLGGGAQGEVLTLPDGSKLAFPTAFASTVTGGAQGDHLYASGSGDELSGLAGGDILEAGVGQDTLTGGTGADTLTGGLDYDLFRFAPGDSGVTAGQIDVITDWEAAFEKIEFTTPMNGGDYAELTATSYAAALQAANQQIATGAMDIVAVSVGNDVIVFADTRNDNGGADDAIVLAGRSLDFSASLSFRGLNPAGANPPPTGGSGGGGGATGPTPSTGTLAFETISPGQALGYNAAVNDLNFSNSRSGASAIFVGFNPDGTVSITQGIGGNQTVTFGSGVYGEANLIFSDGTRAILGSAGDDMLLGAATNDSLFGGPGNDTLNGGRNPDSLFGGDGADLFVIFESSGTLVDTVRDWQPIDRLTFWGPAATAANYVELPAGGSEAEAVAKLTNGEADYVAFQGSNGLGGTSVTILADSTGLNGVGARVLLRDTDLSKIDFSNIVASPLLAFPALRPLPGAPAAAMTAAPGPLTYIGGERPTGGGLFRGNMDTAHIGDSKTGEVDIQTSTSFHVVGGVASSLGLTGKGLTYVEDAVAVYDIPTGTISSVNFQTAGFSASFSGPPVAATTVFHWILDDSTGQMFATYFAGGDDMQGELNFGDQIRGYTGGDTLSGAGGDDILWGGLGNDVIYAIARPGRIGDGVPTTGSTYLRGEEGDDNIYGGFGFDDINGNMGNDTAGGGPGDDYVVGGKDNDLLFGDAGYDLVYGNLGADTCDGGDGNDIVRGGQENDIVRGGAGDDFVSGDKGDDTMTGDAGADIFHTFGDASLDRVTDFSLAQGDRVMLDPGTQFTVSQVGADTVINMTGGGQMILVGVTMSTLTTGWIFGA